MKARLLLLGLYLAAVWVGYGGRDLVDDAYISFRYAEQFAGGAGLVFNAGERVEAYSNLLWVLLLSPFAALHLDLPTVARLLGLLFTAVQLDLSFRIGGWVTALVVVLSPPVLAWSLGGLETPLYGALLTGAVLAAGLPSERRAFTWSAVLFGLVSVCRPEGVMFLLAGAWPRRRRLAWIAVAAVPWIAQLAFRRGYYGEWLPNSYHHRALWSWLVDSVWLTRLSYFAELVLHNAPLIGLAAIGFIRGGYRLRLACLVVAFQLGFILFIGNDWMPGHRHLAPITPCLALIAVTGLRGLRVRRWQVAAALALLVAALAYPRLGDLTAARLEHALERRHPSRFLHYRPATPTHIAWLRLSRELADRHGAITVAHDNGGTMFRDRRLRALDFAGLVSREPARIIAAYRHDPAQGQERLADHVFGRRPEVIVLWAEENGGVHPSVRRPDLGFPLALERHLFDRPEMERDYVLQRTVDVSDPEHPGRRFLFLILGRRDLP